MVVLAANSPGNSEPPSSRQRQPVVGAARPAQRAPGAHARAPGRGSQFGGVRQHALHADRQLRCRQLRHLQYRSKRWRRNRATGRGHRPAIRRHGRQSRAAADNRPAGMASTSVLLPWCTGPKFRTLGRLADRRTATRYRARPPCRRRCSGGDATQLPRLRRQRAGNVCRAGGSNRCRCTETCGRRR